MRQWMLRITAYCERLLSGLDDVDWPASTKTMQREWIGKSRGAEIDFPLDTPDHWGEVFVDDDGEPGAIRVFTTRPDTIFGATFMVLAPEHPIVEAAIVSPTDETDDDALREYVDRAKRKADVERQESKEKTGVFTGLYAINPANGERIPVWCADYVLMGYGHGAIMAVPGQDERDWEFAEAFGLKIVRTVQPPDDFEGDAYTGDGPAINSASSTGCTSRRRRRGRSSGSRRRTSAGEDELSTPRLALLAPAVLGRALPGRLRRAGRPLPGHRTRCP